MKVVILYTGGLYRVEVFKDGRPSVFLIRTREHAEYIRVQLYRTWR